MHSTEINLPISVAADLIGVTSPTLHRWRKAGHILAVELPNGHFRIPVSEVKRITGQGHHGCVVADDPCEVRE